MKLTLQQSMKCVAYRRQFVLGFCKMPIMSKGGAPKDPPASELIKIFDLEAQLTFQDWEAEA